MVCREIRWAEKKLSIHLCLSRNRMGAKKCSGTNPPSAYGLRQIRWYRKASLCTNSPSTYGYTTNPMVRLIRSSQMSTIHIKPYTKSDGAPRQKCLNRPHPFLFPSVSDGAPGKKCLNGLHPHQATLEIRWAPAKISQTGSILTEKEANPMGPIATRCTNPLKKHHRSPRQEASNSPHITRTQTPISPSAPYSSCPNCTGPSLFCTEQDHL